METPERPMSAHFKLQLLTVPDAAVRRNMMRHAAAFRILLPGRKCDSKDLKVLIATGFGMCDASELQYQIATRADRNDRLHLRFDVDDVCGSPDGLGLVRLEGDDTPLYGRCRLWSPAGRGCPVIMFEHEGKCGHFRYRPGKTLKRVDRLPARDLSPGFDRASTQIATLVASERLRVVPEPYVFIPSTQGPGEPGAY